MTKTLTGAAALFALALSLLLSGCEMLGGGPGGNGTVQTRTLRPLPADFSTRKAVAYSGYRGATNGSPTPTIAQIDQDLTLLKGQGFGLLRVFGSNNQMVSDLLGEIANTANGFDFKVQLGIWIAGSKASFDTANQAEIAAGIALANKYPSIVEAVSVGNENMVSWNTWAPAPAADIIAYVTQVRAAIAQPVTSDDNWAVYANLNGAYPKTVDLLGVVDYVSLHSYSLADSIYGSATDPTDPAYWNWQQVGVTDPTLRAAAMMDAALGKTQKDYNAVKTYLASKGFANMPVSIGETGWQSAPNSGGPDRAFPVNQAMYFDRLNGWTSGRPAQIFYFEAFDETWKGTDDGWGLWDVNRNPKWVISRDSTYTLADAKYYIPVVPNGTITKNNYLVYADTVAADAVTAVPTVNQTWIGWNVPWTVSDAEITASGSDVAAEGSKYLEVTPAPASWGWGIFLNNTSPDDLTNFLATGHLHFSIRTTYAGKLEVGFFTKGSTATPGDSDVYLPISSGQYGYLNDGAWHDVSIPIATIATMQAPAYNQPATAVLNMQLVANAFVIADRYVKTNNTAGATTKIDVDHIYWTIN